MAQERDMPVRGEIVLATVSKVMDHGAYVALDEYGDMPGFLHISELAPGWIRSVSKFVRVGEKKVLLVKRVNEERADIDLSLKQVSNDQRKKKLLEVKRYEKGMTLLKSVKERASMSDEEASALEDSLYTMGDSIYDVFMEVARNGTGSLESLKLGKGVLDAISESCAKIRLPSVEIRGMLKIRVPTPDGVDTIIKTLQGATKKSSMASITYLGAPKYRITVSAPDFKAAERELKPILAAIQSKVGKKGTYEFSREESKKVREE